MSTARGEQAPTSESIRRHVLFVQEMQHAQEDLQEKTEQMAHAAMNSDERCQAYAEGVSGSGERLARVRCYLTTTHEGAHHGWVVGGGEMSWPAG